MVTYIRMPQKGLTEESAILSEWFVKKGDKVKEGDYVFSIETGKATFNVESEVSGTVLETIGNAGDEIPVKKIVCVIGEEGDTYEIEENNEKTQQVQEEETPKTQPQLEVKEEKEAPQEEDIIRISPRARALADKKGIDIRFAKGSGPKGRIVEQDIRDMFETGPFVNAGKAVAEQIAPISKVEVQLTHVADMEENEFEVVPNSNIRKITAKNMHKSLHDMAQLTINSHFDATKVLEYRESIKESSDKLGLSNITINDIIVFAVSRTLTDFLYLNAHYSDSEMKLFKNTHIGIAVDTKRGLMVPTLFNANKKPLNEISKEAKNLISKCKDGIIEPQLLSGGTFTITNLGAYRVDSFTPVINPPQVAILGVGSIEYKVKMDKGQIVHYPAMSLSLTIDHRAVDGAPAARFLTALAENLENLYLLLSK